MSSATVGCVVVVVMVVLVKLVKLVTGSSIVGTRAFVHVVSTALACITGDFARGGGRRGEGVRSLFWDRNFTGELVRDSPGRIARGTNTIFSLAVEEPELPGLTGDGERTGAWALTFLGFRLGSPTMSTTNGDGFCSGGSRFSFPTFTACGSIPVESSMGESQPPPPPPLLDRIGSSEEEEEEEEESFVSSSICGGSLSVFSGLKMSEGSRCPAATKEIFEWRRALPEKLPWCRSVFLASSAREKFLCWRGVFSRSKSSLF